MVNRLSLGDSDGDQRQEDESIAKQQSKSGTVRVQYGALPYRRNEAGEVEVLLLTSRTRRRWIIPKGWPIKGLKPAKSAAREAFEEAGVRGVISGKPLGRFTYNKLLDEDGRAVICEVTVFSLTVKRQLKVWPEVEQRETRWVAASEAGALTDEDGLRPILEAFSVKMEAKRKLVPKQRAEEAKVSE
ncbi:NUDIX hydrolase [Acidisoma cellulosilytica]|uniref:NUDIX hydrolase n=1 Tax=Acidisoma cellulosilyticum TaxID=2802395 RepID=A0A964E5V5_9PROT|nr:NUDIX hydrolase [Acidisoma cellulosilyticum]MCB8882916.1 NUDIX hydrolase [Acidisoma cellulosilyticum]